MNKIKIISFVVLLVALLSFTAYAIMPKGESNWPMSGGPNGTWKITTKKSVPTSWSVRNNEHIKWKKTLPEGGQSGIIVWEDNVFFTINPPLDTPPYAIAKKKYEQAEKDYNDEYAATEKRLSNEKEYKTLVQQRAISQKAWDDLLANDEKLKKMGRRDGERYINRTLVKTDIGKALQASKAKYHQYIVKKSDKLKDLDTEKQKRKAPLEYFAKTRDIILYCVSAKTGETKWTKTIEGTIEAEYHYGFSDATTPSPMTDGKHVWALNATGGMACLTMEGEVVWTRKWNPSPVVPGKPFNRQFESILYEDFIFNIEPAPKGDKQRVEGWNYLFAINKNTGKVAWISEDGLTYYNTPVIGRMKDNTPAILIGRGGPHKVPERPVGMSMVSLKKGSYGKSIWRWECQDPNAESGYGALNTQVWSKDYCMWVYKRNHHCTVDANTGKLIAKHETSNAKNYYEYDLDKKGYVLKHDEPVVNDYAFYSNVLHKDYVFYLTMYEPFLNRLNVKTGLFEKLELPTELSEKGGKKIWKEKQRNDGLNAQGQKHYKDARILGGGDQRHFHGSIITINNLGYFTSALGITYVIDLEEKDLSKALISVNDIGEKGKTWTANSMSYSNGKLFHRTLKELICIE